ncbi:MAG TPA: Na+/H+ antiporter NhaC family protein [Cryomorphaceae bacterium]|nr:Na+/H+ antiporter NhaC family protein [Cryomorphaceae bacterium]
MVKFLFCGVMNPFLKSLLISAFAICSFLPVSGQDESIFSKDDFSVELPHLIVEGLESSGTLICDEPDKLYLLGNSAQVLINGERRTLSFQDGKTEIPMTFDRNEPLSIKIGGFTFVKEITPMPLWLSILPPFLVIVLALAFKEVVSSLILGIFAGAMIVSHYAIDSSGIFIGFLNSIDIYMVEAMADEGHVSVILFSTLIGGIVALISKNGGMQAVVDKISRKANNPKSGQMATWFLGIGIFFDDYANTLVVGNTMRPLTDRLKISREKLSYIVDSTAAPIAAIALITTWIGAELGYIQSALDQINAGGNMIEAGPYIIFLGSLKYSFYPVFALIFMLILIQRNRDFGPMYKAEVSARKGVVASNANKIDSSELDEFAPQEGAKLNMWNAIIPILIVVIVTMLGLVYTGYMADPSVWGSPEFPLSRKLSIIIGNSDSYKGLLWASMLGLMVAVLLSVGRKTMSFVDAISASIDGFKTMVPAMVILILAWSLAALTDQMHTADYLTSLVEGRLAVWALPPVTFLLSALVAFSTGSSWGTMAIIYPIMLPLAWGLSLESGLEAASAMEIFLNTTSCVLAGAVLGDHCSPISDTTILSSLATRCDHLQHVKTQMPYALTVGLVAITFTTLSAVFDIPWLLNYLIGGVLLFFVVSFLGKKVSTD